ncbi:phosphonate C-P lyase system protein PhnL [Nocardia vermiculata]|uniref:Phosphonate C-P lyase system protein PhnL n=1 Tax=Nocardia vermiculata TaxID=257274 RepID=A0A846Y017_9NOCA|nr:phosphonate C-P lyase system protein PhnL [Nocardia vermiculata]NKY50991.1 phosphonate C-P lyase system protein PhnL [Nocardia vermiculata]
MIDSNLALSIIGVHKTFTLHLQGGQHLPVVRGVDIDVPRGRCVVLGGDSGAGKSTILKMVYGSYAAHGRILLPHRGGVLDLVTAEPRQILSARRHTMSYVSQFLRAVPRVAAVDVVAEPLIERGTERDRARAAAGELLERLSIPTRLWQLPPATFSGGEQQRVNIARGLIAEHPLLLLDEPTASLDARNRAVVIELIRERLARGVGMLAIFHDTEVRDRLADEIVDVRRFAPEASGAEHGAPAAIAS